VTDLLAAIGDPARAAIDARRVAVIVAHPDDETIGCGALLARLRGARLVVVTDGAPADPGEARAHGFDTPEAYAAARRGELEAACALSACAGLRLERWGMTDGEVARHLPPLARRLAALFDRAGVEAALTHAFEGGHPDHDAVSFAVAAAARLAARAPAVIEMPYYRVGGIQDFAFAGVGVRVALTPSERLRKRRMLAAHRTQRAMLRQFGTRAELFRLQPVHGFAGLPNGGRLFYEERGWFTGAEWMTRASAALAELGLDAPCP
jgi:LmbE family N-acetylglucosaminyl deacetylase